VDFDSEVRSEPETVIDRDELALENERGVGVGGDGARWNILFVRTVLHGLEDLIGKILDV
jgi:hypothetical protein